MRPRSGTRASSAKANARSTFCSARIIVILALSRIASSAANRFSTTIGAKPSNGSSSNRIFGPPTSARAMASICCSPPLNRLPVVRRRSASKGNSAKTRSSGQPLGNAATHSLRRVSVPGRDHRAMPCGYISASRSGCAWWRSCWRPAPIIVSHETVRQPNPAAGPCLPRRGADRAMTA